MGSIASLLQFAVCYSRPKGKLTRWQALLHTCLYSLALDSEWYPAPKSKLFKKRTKEALKIP